MSSVRYLTLETRYTHLAKYSKGCCPKVKGFESKLFRVTLKNVQVPFQRYVSDVVRSVDNVTYP